MSSYALLASPTFTGTPAAPTATAGTNTTQLATTAFVLANGAGSNLLTTNNTWTNTNNFTNNSAGSGTAPVTQYNIISKFNATTPTSGQEIGSGIRFIVPNTGGGTFYGGEIVGAINIGTDHYLLINTYSNGTINTRIRISGNTGNVTIVNSLTVTGGISGSSFTAGSIPIASIVGTACDLTTNQTIAGVKTFSSAPVHSGASITSGTVPIAAIVGTACDLTTNQTITGIKTFPSPVLTGTPTCPTAASTNNSTQIASCAFVQSVVATARYASFLLTSTQIIASNTHTTVLLNTSVVANSISLNTSTGVILLPLAGVYQINGYYTVGLSGVSMYLLLNGAQVPNSMYSGAATVYFNYFLQTTTASSTLQFVVYSSGSSSGLGTSTYITGYPLHQGFSVNINGIA